jgi:hypothetical protein
VDTLDLKSQRNFVNTLHLKPRRNIVDTLDLKPRGNLWTHLTWNPEEVCGHTWREIPRNLVDTLDLKPRGSMWAQLTRNPEELRGHTWLETSRNLVDTLDLKTRKILWTLDLKPRRNFVDTLNLKPQRNTVDRLDLKTWRNFEDTLYAAQHLIMALAIGPNSVVAIPLFTRRRELVQFPKVTLLLNSRRRTKSRNQPTPRAALTVIRLAKYPSTLCSTAVRNLPWMWAGSHGAFLQVIF